ncbi:MAG: 50S ribosomal protein L18 [Neisseriaceae bacterium]|nr:MAG: 50S ribosomal protein L18 [Neisseriaceae bacterium]
MNKNQSRIRRASKTRAKIANSRSIRLTVYRSNNNIYAQILSADNEKVLAYASSLESAVRSKYKIGNTTDVAAEVGKLIAERAKSVGIVDVAFDRSGYKYHGRVKALADAAKANGLNC